MVYQIVSVTPNLGFKAIVFSKVNISKTVYLTSDKVTIGQETTHNLSNGTTLNDLE